MELKDLFDLIIIINAAHRADRRQEMRQELQRVGWDPDAKNVVWFPAIDPKSTCGFTTPGARGCFLSHTAVLGIAGNRRCRRALILEDDCDFVPDFADRQAAVAASLDSTPWGIAYLGHRERLDGPPGLREWPADRELLLLHCYAVTGDLAARAAAYMSEIPLRPVGSPEGGPMSSDGGVNWFRRANPDVKTVLAAPSLAHQRSSRSDLLPNWYDRVPVLNTVAARLKKRRRPAAATASATHHRAAAM